VGGDAHRVPFAPTHPRSFKEIRSRKSEKILWLFVLLLVLVPWNRFKHEEEDE
jgi:hypothetical protein